MRTPCLVLFDYEPTQKTTKEDRDAYKEVKRVSHLTKLVQRLDSIIRRRS